MKKRILPVVAWGLIGVLVLSTVWLFSSTVVPQDTVLSATLGDPRLAAFEDWPARYNEIAGDENYTVRMSYVDGLSDEFTQARGRTVINFETGQVLAKIEGLPPLEKGYSYELLLVDNQEAPGNSIALDAGPKGDDIISLGFVDGLEAAITLEKQIDVDRLNTFEVDMALVRRTGEDGSEAFIIGGMADLFFKWNRKMSLESEGEWGNEGTPGLPQTAADDMERLMRRGESLFVSETFDGNGRTCATCHRLENNFTIDPAFIATLPDNDPLFVAEFQTPLIFGHPDNLDADGNPRRFENPLLMRQVGLIVENTNGTADLQNNFTMRGVPHTRALNVSIDSNQSLGAGEDCSTTACPRLGWSGDGSDNSNPAGGLNGSLRAFAPGAVKQHFTKTLDRVPGSDFRLPTDREMDALEAFQISLGRQTEIDLPNTQFRDIQALAGRDAFLASGCNGCHGNAGANATFGPLDGSNANFDTGVELIDGTLADLLDAANNPPDDGFGGPDDFGNGTFNTTVLVEAADTPPFFHNNSVETLEEAVAFYATNDFQPAPLDIGAAEIDNISKMLRVLNAVENARFADEYLRRAANELVDMDGSRASDPSSDVEPNRRRAVRLARLAIKEASDGKNVLAERSLHDTDPIDAQSHFMRAINQTEAAINEIRKDNLREALGHLRRASNQLNGATSKMVE